MTSNPRVPFELSTHRPRLTGPQGKPLIVHCRDAHLDTESCAPDTGSSGIETHVNATCGERSG